MANKKYKLTDGNMWATDGIHDLGQNKTQRTINSEVNTALGGKAPTNHASTSTTYGKGTSSNYGHVKISDSLTDTTPAATGGVVPSMKAVSDLNGAINQNAKDIAYIINGKRPTTYVPKGDFVLLRNSTISGRADGLYTAHNALSISADVSSSDLDSTSGGGLNSVGSYDGTVLLDTTYAASTINTWNYSTVDVSNCKFILVNVIGNIANMQSLLLPVGPTTGGTVSLHPTSSIYLDAVWYLDATTNSNNFALQITAIGVWPSCAVKIFKVF